MKRVLRTVSLIAGLITTSWLNSAYADFQECTVCGNQVGDWTSYCCTSVSGSDGSIGLPARAMTYVESFENGGNLTWLNWENCATDNNYYAIDYYDGNDVGAPNGGVYAMRLHTGGLNQTSCAYPGMYATSPALSLGAAGVYRFGVYTRNASNYLLFTVLWFDANGNLIQVNEGPVSSDSWSWHSTVQEVRSPVNAAYAQVRFGLQTASEYADIDYVTAAYYSR